MLSTAGSRFQIPAQVMFHIINGVGFFTGMVYNHSTPDLYVGNAHHSLGWVVVASTIVWTLLSICVTCGKRRATVRAPEKPSRAQNLEEYGLLNQYEGRLSRDSGHGTERHSESLLASRQNSSDSSHPQFKATTDDLSLSEENDIESKKFTGHSIGFISRTIGRLRTENTLQGARFAQTLLEKILLLLGFVALLSGLIVSGGLFRDREIFSGLAHFIKGGIFFWYGLLTLGRWMGAFTEFGWAWNIRPQPPLVAKWKWRIPSAEFTESFVIWLYGASNVFLEHLNNWGKDWSAQDLEHVSITILFFGGGLLGMLVESDWLRKLINTPIIVQKCDKEEEYQASGPLRTDTDEWSEPQTYRAPMNPMPATVIMLLGMMMGAHHQSSMVSTMMHAQWGGLFTAFGIARATTYVLMYIKPPTSHFAGRPPSELVAAFCLTSGGIIFMNSASDTVAAIEENGLDAMTIFTLTMGLTGVVMTWQIVVFAVRGWAIRRERAAAGRPLSW
ncbi:related to integral membrane protein [Ramularia collo-cygni]|uniref:Related to integral membrane protein n=1 Tax=Ramularia collo-cygni TaxID=112498 RepID=A0A2D3UWL3_9PEZI|nr:related to integral membrane protein [Ramularia collo-cygni]CZT18665.1 related to integral membrane protein [Ramularia collo-cygni]